MHNHSLDALSGCQSGRGSFPKGVRVADENSQGDSWYEARIKTSPTPPNNMDEKQQQEESVMA